MSRALRASLAFALLLVALAPSRAERIQKYDGAAKIGNLDRITVVYPDAPGERGAIHRDSAALRASYLTERYGVRTEIAADTEITQGQLAGHLLVLGWDNRLLGTSRAPAPWRRTADELVFAGLGGARPDDDLLFMHFSPYDPSKYLVFWSRIDPLRDRFLAFPFLGSDWGIYRDYFVLKQGMLLDEPLWPPERNHLAQRQRRPVRPEVRARSEHYALHSAIPDLDAQRVDAILEAREAALAAAAELLEHRPSASFRVDLFVYRDAEQKHRLTDVADPVHSLTGRAELHMPLDQAAAAHPHEEIHLLAHEAFGPCSLTAFFEGLAFFLEHRGRRADLDAYAALLEKRDVPFDFQVLFDDERLRKVTAAGAGFAPAGLLVDWLEQLGGLELVGRAYTLRRGNAEERLNGLVQPYVERERVQPVFETWLARRAEAARSELAYREVLARADERGRVGDFFGRAAALAEALEMRPDEAQVAYQLALSLIETGQYDRARERLEGLLALEDGQLPSYVRIYSHYQLGRIHELLGETARAVERYRRVLELPDELEAHRRARRALEHLEGSS